ncbi:FACT complex subunit SPT16 [Clonorchis sinensis]|uniref:FACT complex subunit n=1 Tax=Clonorchis sinensis TaxID=79923 RepID=A0A8T1N0Q9_CLOSI|nr:FACT complex subunit SPT16 [Clonorchis sinensis]
MMSTLKLDIPTFQLRCDRLYKDWKSNPSSQLYEVDALVVPAGKFDSVYGKTLSLHTWLFGYELQDTVIVFCEKSVLILCGKKKLDFLQPLQKRNDENREVILIPRNQADNDKAGIEKLISAISTSRQGRVIGHLSKDKFSSELTKAFQSALSSGSFELRDVSGSISDLFAVKDENELNILKKASAVTCNIFSKHLKEEIMEIIDYDKKVKHDKLSSGCHSALKKTNLLNGLDPDSLEMCYDPIIQSGGNFNLKFSIESDTQNLHFGTIICALGVRYQSYCSNVIRSLMVNPTEDQAAVYAYLHDLFDWAIAAIKPGVKIAEFCQSIQDKVQSERPELADCLVRSFGFVTGIEFRDSHQLLTSKSTGVFREGMTLNFNIGLQNVKNPKAENSKDKQYALWLGDVVGVATEADGSNTVFTLAAKRRPKSVSLYIRDEEEDEEDEQGEDNAAAEGSKKSSSKRDSALNGLEKRSIPNGDAELLGRGHRRTIIAQKTRSEQTAEEKRMSRRRELFDQLVTSSTNRLSGMKTDTGPDTKAKSTVAYKGAGQMPKEDDIRRLRLFVDKKYETVILPIFGLPTPFHISTIKNVSTSIEADYTYLRINFHHPGAIVGAKDVSGFQTPEAIYVKEMTYRASNLRRHGEATIPATNLNNTCRIIKEVLKRFRSREAEERERADLVEQDQLIVDHAKGAFRLKDLYIRPNIATKRITGTLQTHTNGFRFTSIRGDQIDILYNNIKHAFYQPCDGEMIILLHFHLKNAIMYGKKKQQDIQFYTEVGELTTDLSKAHSRMQDRDDLEAEQREREMREQIKTAFRSFVDKAEALARRYNLEFETPFRDLGFYGCPHRSTVFLMPTSSALISVTELPPFVVTLDEVEFIMLERVTLSIRTFDMVFVFKDYTKKPAMINSIPSTALELVKEWLLSCDLYYAEGTKSLNWPKLMKSILDNPEGFIEDGGWSFISPEEDDDEDEENSEEEDENYAPSASELSGEGDEDASGADSSSEDDDDEDWEAEEESDEPESLDSDESEGKDWEELEEEAKREDAKNLLLDEDDSSRRKSSKKRHHSPDSHKKSSKKHKHR